MRIALWIASPQKSATGGRPNIVLFDDIVSETNYLTEQGLKRARHCVETSLTLGSRDSRYIDVGTSVSGMRGTLAALQPALAAMLGALGRGPGKGSTLDTGG